MIQLFEIDKLIVGEKYYVKKKSGYLQTSNSNVPNILIGIYKWHHSEYVGFKLSNYINPLYIDPDFYVFDIHLNEFYRYISPEEYRIKLKEKYDATCLNIILKRLVNENFQW